MSVHAIEVLRKPIDFLLARIAEDEEAAHRCAATFPGAWEVEDRGYHAHVVSGEPDCHRVAELDQRQTSADWLGGALAMIADFQPARIFAESAAKRTILAAHRPSVDPSGDVDGATCTMCTDSGPDAQGFPCSTVRTIAAIYADHPDYNPNWAL